MFGFLQSLVVWIISAAALVGAIWAFIDATKHADSAYRSAGRNSKVLWLVILGVAAVVAFVSLPPLPFGPNILGFSGGGITWLLGIAAIVAVVFYFVDVRPKVSGHSGGGRSSGGW